jgi:hypothetical protein
MDPAESIVELWLQNQGYFTRNGVEVGRRGKEIDFLAVDIVGGKRLHVESAVSVNPFGSLRPWGPVKHSKLSIQDRVRLYFQNKFVGSVDQKTYKLLDHIIEEKVTESFKGMNYKRWLILGEQKEGAEKIRKEFRKHRVEVHYMDEVLKEIRLTGTPKGTTARFLQIMARYGSEESKQSLLIGAKSYVKGKSCGRGKHDYERHEKYLKCRKCGSLKTIK